MLFKGNKPFFFKYGSPAVQWKAEYFAILVLRENNFESLASLLKGGILFKFEVLDTITTFGTIPNGCR